MKSTSAADAGTFVARQAVFLHRQGLDAATVQSRIAEAFGSDELAALRRQLAPAPGSFRAALLHSLQDLALPNDALALRCLALEQSVEAAYLGIWRSMFALALYTLGIAVIATVVLQILQLFVVPPFKAMISGADGIPQLPHLVFEAGIGTALIIGLWLFSLWALASIVVTRRAILLRSWPHRLMPFNMLIGGVLRHRVLLRGWTTALLLDSGVDSHTAIARAGAVIDAWCGTRYHSHTAMDERHLGSASGLGTLRDEVDHQVAAELVEAPLSMASNREYLALFAGLVCVSTVAPIVIAMYTMLLKTASLV